MTWQVALLRKPSSNVKMTIRGMYPHDLYGNRAHKARFLSTRLLHNDQKQQGIPKMCLTCFVAGIIMKAVWEWVTGDKGPAFNIKLSSYQYRNSHCGDNTSSGRLISTMLIPVLVRIFFISNQSPYKRVSQAKWQTRKSNKICTRRCYFGFVLILFFVGVCVFWGFFNDCMTLHHFLLIHYLRTDRITLKHTGEYNRYQTITNNNKAHCVHISWDVRCK